MDWTADAVKLFGAFGVCLLILGAWIRHVLADNAKKEAEKAELLKIVVQMQDKRAEERERNASVMAGVANSLNNLSSAVNGLSESIRDMEREIAARGGRRKLT